MNALVPIVFLFITFLSCNLGDRIRLEKTFQHTENIRDAQMKFRNRNNRYADLRELVKLGELKSELEDGKDVGCIFNLEGQETEYQLTVVPEDENEPLSLYLDQTGIIRVSLDPKS